MKIQICGSMKFAKEMKSVKEELETLGHKITIPTNTDDHIEDPDFVDNLKKNYDDSVEKDTIRECFKLVADAQAILILNYKRNGVDGYLGTSTLMEIGLAYYLRKKIFLLNPIPHYDEVRWAHEVMIMNPTIINGDLSKIK